MVRRAFDESMVERSPLSGEVAGQGRKVFVEIYCAEARSTEWMLEVLDEDDFSTVWQKGFASDKEALEAFQNALATFGIAAFFSSVAAKH